MTIAIAILMTVNAFLKGFRIFSVGEIPIWVTAAIAFSAVIYLLLIVRKSNQRQRSLSESSTQMPLDASSVCRKRSGRRMLLALTLSLSALAWVLIFRWRFYNTITEFGLEVHWITHASLSDFLPFLLLIVLMITWITEFDSVDPSVADGWNRNAILVSLGAFVVFVIGVFLPLLRLLLDHS